MAEAAIPVDLFNPGQVFACIGFAEAADVLLGHAQGVFDWSDPAGAVFRLRADGEESPVLRVLRFIDAATAQAVAPEGSQAISAWRQGWGLVPKVADPGAGYPYPDPIKPAKLVCELSDGIHTLVIDHWGDSTSRDPVKFWSGSAGYPGATLARDALAAIGGNAAAALADPFAFSRPQTSSFGLDWRRDYIPLDIGYSINQHGGRIVTVGFPLVELLGALGLGNARPERRSRMLYSYAVSGRQKPYNAIWLPLPLLRSSLGGASLPFATRRFQMRLDKVSESAKSRSITTVTEEDFV